MHQFVRERAPSRQVDTIQEVASAALSLVRRLQQAVKASSADNDLFAGVQASIARLPLASGEFALANRRLHNARVYYGQGELGVAAFELTMLRGAIAREAENVWGL
jgi:hypothetical protein